MSMPYLNQKLYVFAGYLISAIYRGLCFRTVLVLYKCDHRLKVGLLLSLGRR